MFQGATGSGPDIPAVGDKYNSRGSRPKSLPISDVKFCRLLRGLELLREDQGEGQGQGGNNGGAVEKGVQSRAGSMSVSGLNGKEEGERGEEDEEDPLVLLHVGRLQSWHEDKWEEVSLNCGKRRLIADWFECSNEKSFEVGAAVATLYGDLGSRAEQVAAAVEREGIKVTIGGDTYARLRNDRSQGAPTASVQDRQEEQQQGQQQQDTSTGSGIGDVEAEGEGEALAGSLLAQVDISHNIEEQEAVKSTEELLAEERQHFEVL